MAYTVRNALWNPWNEAAIEYVLAGLACCYPIVLVNIFCSDVTLRLQVQEPFYNSDSVEDNNYDYHRLTEKV
eukprot:CAMPEP_0115006454 /NCGR_PEP_ID=MMETSP0216-20121206/20515_1 /TAXON_ID=223996 /ORGANISM="Protocruzia adherens, Strain Boccale" /LENGTH=71 /DNA_ID=CAMNT_0002373051 /DNA_START=595 /DNA_END=810 /DNA_ORIENTATION=+